jgi:hypothetical protein
MVLTSNDPAFSEKLNRVRSILADLHPDEAFFSIDEFGPFAVKTKSGLSLVARNEQRVVPQWQKSRGCVGACDSLSSFAVWARGSTMRRRKFITCSAARPCRGRSRSARSSQRRQCDRAFNLGRLARRHRGMTGRMIRDGAAGP